MKSQKRRPSVGSERFVEVCEKSRSLEEAARRLGMDRHTVYARIWSYRKKGIPVKELRSRNRKGRKQLNVSELSMFIGSIRRGDKDASRRVPKTEGLAGA